MYLFNSVWEKENEYEGKGKLYDRSIVPCTD